MLTFLNFLNSMNSLKVNNKNYIFVSPDDMVAEFTHSHLKVIFLPWRGFNYTRKNSQFETISTKYTHSQMQAMWQYMTTSTRSEEGQS